MLGAFVDGTLAGFAGFHGEGSIGLLEVLPAYRRRGLGKRRSGGGAAGAGAGAVCLWPGAYRQRPLPGPPEKGWHDGRPGTALLAVSQIKSHLGRPESVQQTF
ncbi:MAG: GNAT family N-acetyltransferase [Flavonifractor plautii]